MQPIILYYTNNSSPYASVLLIECKRTTGGLILYIERYHYEP